MKKIVIKNAMCMATMDDSGRVLKDSDIEIQGKKISKIEKNIPTEGAEVISGEGKLVLPGFINTHHHFYQTLTRNLKEAQDAKLFDWLVYHYEVWRHISMEGIYQSTRLAMAELLLTGCTTTSDHLYFVHRKNQKNAVEYFGQQVRAAEELGMRFHLARGSMSRGRSQGGLPPDDTVQDEKSIMQDSEKIIDAYHDETEFSMLRVFLAPCSPFSVTTDLMKEAAALARDKGVCLHTHLCETRDEEEYSIEKYGRRPYELMEYLGWTGSDVWYAHGIHFNDDEIKRLGKSRTGIAHCPVSNLRLGSGIARVPDLLKAGARVGLAVDGSASADSSNMLRELKSALLVHRVGSGVSEMPAYTVLKLATGGGAEILGRSDIGVLKEGKAADIAIFNMDKIDYVGALHDPPAALLFCGTDDRGDTVIVNGKIVVKDSALCHIDERELIESATRESEALTYSL